MKNFLYTKSRGICIKFPEGYRDDITSQLSAIDENDFVGELRTRIAPRILLGVRIDGKSVDIVFCYPHNVLVFPSGPRWTKVVSSSVFEKDPKTGLYVGSAWRDGKPFSREPFLDGPAALEDFFPEWHNFVEDVVYRLLKEHGIVPDRLCVSEEYWLEIPEPEPEEPVWVIEESVTIPDPFNHAADDMGRIRMYSMPGKDEHVYTSTCLAAFDDEYGVTKVFFDFGGLFTPGCEDFTYKDSARNDDRFLKSLGKAWKESLETSDPDERRVFFRSRLRELMGKR